MAAKRSRPASGALPEDFEATMRELRSIVERLESEDGGLEAAVTHFERGVRLQQHAQRQLEAARLRIEELLPEGGLAEIDADDDEEEE
ncbi:MAG: exodeoxyribonuclease VII small subunit [Candidatus Limnocylindrus sp.]|jgi:exodeoxyribonuclease VII small subunit